MTYTRPGAAAPSHAVHQAESIPNDIPVVGLAAGGTRTLRMGAATWTDVSYRVAAVIYGDGATAGDGAIIAHLIRVRARELGDIQQVLPLLQSAASDPTASRPALIQEFENRVEAGKTAVRDGLSLPVRDFVCQSVLANLQHPRPSNLGVGAQAAILVRMVSGWATQLQLSLPRLSPAS